MLVVIYTAVMVALLVSNWDVVFYGYNSTVPRDIDSEYDVNVTQTNAGEKLILFWNQFFHANDFRFGFGREPFLKYGCDVNACVTTSDRGQIQRADAMLVHTPLLNDLPPKPTENQTYVMVQVEPHMAHSAALMPSLAGYFKLTMTYRRDSDVTIHYAHRKRNRAFAELVDADPRERPKSVVWVVSHCETPSKRELYVEELKKYIDIDIYGSCGSYECPKKNNTYCREMYEKTYRFYLSFENDVCKDYATEKLYHPLRYKIVPVVYGGADYDQIAPPHSVINIQDYPDARDLARYLKYLGDNRTAYNEYFKWKRNGIWFDLNPHLRMANAMCKLCEILHDKDYVYKDYSDISSWWVLGSCNNSVMDTMSRSWRRRS